MQITRLERTSVCGALLIAGACFAMRASGPESAPGAELAAPIRIDAAGKPIDVEQSGAAPCFADFDDDGLADLLLGGGDGSVTFYRRKRAPGDTSLEKGRTLVPPYFHDEQDIGPTPGRNARLCVCDFNGDGRFGLLVGDIWVSVVAPEITLTAEERAHDAALEKKLDSLSAKFAALRKTPENETFKAREKRLGDLRAISGRMRAMRQELSRPPPKPIVTPHGRVWIYLRRKAE